MRKFFMLVAVFAVVAMAGQASAVEISVHGDLNNRFNLYTNQSQIYKTFESVSRVENPVTKDSNNAFWGDIKYRLWTDLATNDGKIKLVYAIELGAIRFGQDYSKGGGGTYSGDGVNIETRWAYTDFQLPFVKNKARVTIGLQPWKVNHYVWQETVMGVQLKGEAAGVDYTLGWARGKEFYPTKDYSDAFQDQDAFLLRGDFKPMTGTKAGLFALYQRNDAFGNGVAATNYEIKRFGADQYDIYTIGTDGTFTTPTQFGNAFLNWDLIYQGGRVDDGGNNIWGNAVTKEDVSAYFLHADAGLNFGKTKLTYTGWYASGDDDPTDDKINNFMSTDVDMFDSVVFFEGGYTDDNYFTEAPYILDKGMILNKVAADYKANDKTTVGGALLYLMTAEDLPNGENQLGTEVDAYVSHKLFPNTELAVNFGYLFAGDGMSYFSDTGDKTNIYRSTARVRYKF